MKRHSTFATALLATLLLAVPVESQAFFGFFGGGFGFGFGGGGVSGSLGFQLGQSSSRSIVSTTPSLTTTNGYPGSISSGLWRSPFR